MIDGYGGDSLHAEGRKRDVEGAGRDFSVPHQRSHLFFLEIFLTRNLSGVTKTGDTDAPAARFRRDVPPSPSFRLVAWSEHLEANIKETRRIASQIIIRTAARRGPVRVWKG